MPMSFLVLAHELRLWSERTFGTLEERGPTGPLKHLALEAQEAIDSPGDITELADCLILVLDATWRSGFRFPELVEAAQKKLDVLHTRSYPKVADGEISEHVRDE